MTVLALEDESTALAIPPPCRGDEAGKRGVVEALKNGCSRHLIEAIRVIIACYRPMGVGLDQGAEGVRQYFATSRYTHPKLYGHICAICCERVQCRSRSRLHSGARTPGADGRPAPQAST